MSREERGVKGVKKVTFWQKEYSDKSIFVITALIGMVLLSVSYFYAVRFEKHYFKDAQEARDQNETMVQNMANTGKNLVQTLFHPTIVDNTGDLLLKQSVPYILAPDWINLLCCLLLWDEKASAPNFSRYLPCFAP